jgi:hypothetical protein
VPVEQYRRELVREKNADPLDPALFAARVRIACPSFVDVDEVVLGSA